MNNILIIFICVLLFIGAYFYFFYQKFVKEPILNGELKKYFIDVDNFLRSYLVYVPHDINDNPDLLFALHGYKDTADIFRKRTSYEFDKIADDNNCIIVYPDGYKKSWNDCRKKSTYPAKLKDIDDEYFLKAIELELNHKLKVRFENIFLFGFSNGGHLVNKLCMETPSWISAAAIIGASLPVNENIDCNSLKKPVSILIINGTADPVNPYNGGLVNVLGIKKMGYVLSSEETIKYWAKIAGYESEPEQFYYFKEIEKGNIENNVTAIKSSWSNKNKKSIALVSILKGGHTIPNLYSRFPKVTGKTCQYINAAKLVWGFFENVKDNK